MAVPCKNYAGGGFGNSSITKKGLLGDRTFALIDKKTNRVVSAKNPKKYGEIFKFSAETLTSPEDNQSLPRVSITFPDGETLFTDDKNVNEVLSEKIGRSVLLTSHVPDNAKIEKVTLEDDELKTTDAPSYIESLSPFNFFDGGPLHILTTHALNRLRSFYKEGEFEAKRFRPNIVIDSDDTEFGTQTSMSLEQNCEDLVFEIGDTVKVKVTKPTERCIITTLASSDLSKDNKILKTIDANNGGFLGVYTQTLEPGLVQMGDLVWMVGSKINFGNTSSLSHPQNSLSHV